jgi:hypothetical protein
MRTTKRNGHWFHRAVSVFGVACLLALSGGCGNSGDDASATAASSSPAGPRYGYGPVADGAFVYQPDVVLIGGGGSAIRSASSDGLVWTIDANAPGARELAVGKIMFATADSVGRVIKLEPMGNDLAVTLAPVDLTDVVREGQITVDEVIGFDEMSFQAIPDLPGAMSEPIGAAPPATPTSGAAPAMGTLVAPTIRLMAMGDPPPGDAPGKLPAPSRGSQFKAKVGDWDVTAYGSATRVGVRAEHTLVAGSGLTVGLNVHINTENLRVTANVPVHNGVVGDSSNIQIDGITGIGIEIDAGAREGLSDNRKIRVELPIEISKPILIGGFPAMLKQKFSFIVETAFSAKNGNLTAAGLWKLDGPIGIKGSTVLVPAFSVEKSILESLQGVSVGINSIVAAVSFRFSVGVGLPVASAGPYVSLISSVALLNGSSAAIVKCRQSTLTMTASGGIGIAIAAPVRKVVDFLLDKILPGTKVPDQKELLTKDIVKSSQWTPDVAVCKLGN